MKPLFRKAATCALSAAMLLHVGSALAADKAQDMAVQLNGAPWTLSEVAPQVKEQTVYMPLRVMLEVLKDAEIDFNQGVIRAKTANEVVSLRLGSDQVTVEKNGQTETVTLDAAVYIDPTSWRTYVPIGFIENVLGYRAGYDEQEKTVIIADPAELLKQATEGKTFTYMNRMAGFDKRYDKGNWNIDWKADGFLTLNQYKTPVSVRMSGIAAEGSQFQMAFNITLDLSEYLANTKEADERLSDEVVQILKTTGFKQEVRSDIESGNLYILMQEESAKLTDRETGVWYKARIGNWGPLGENKMQSFMSMMASFRYDDASDMLNLFLDRSDFAHIGDWNAVLSAMKTMYNNISDTSFQKEGNTYVLDYKPVAESGMDRVRLTVTMDGDNVTAYTTYYDFHYTDAKTNELVRVIRDETTTNENKSVHVQGYRNGTLVRDMTRQTTYTPGTTAPKYMPDEGEVVRDMEEQTAVNE